VKQKRGVACDVVLHEPMNLADEVLTKKSSLLDDAYVRVQL
jgi:hypothetical protein